MTIYVCYICVIITLITLLQSKGVIHHGGAGTTATALYAGVPQAVLFVLCHTYFLSLSLYIYIYIYVYISEALSTVYALSNTLNFSLLLTRGVYMYVIYIYISISIYQLSHWTELTSRWPALQRLSGASVRSGCQSSLSRHRPRLGLLLSICPPHRVCRVAQGDNRRLTSQSSDSTWVCRWLEPWSNSRQNHGYHGGRDQQEGSEPMDRGPAWGQSTGGWVWESAGKTTRISIRLLTQSSTGRRRIFNHRIQDVKIL